MNIVTTKKFLLSMLVVSAGWVFPIEIEAAGLLIPPNNLGLAAYWSFNEGTSTIATDFSGNGNHATFAGGTANPTWATGKRKMALSFDSSDDYASALHSNSLNITGALTIAFWVKRSSIGEFHDWFGKGIGSSDRIQYYVSGHNDEFFFQFCTDALAACTGAHARQSTNANQVANRWYHIAITYSDAGNAIVLYQDGVPLSESDFLGDPENSSMISTTHPIRIGEMYSGDAANATFDELRVYSRVLTQTEVQALYRASALKFGASTADLQKGSTLELGLTGHWTFDGQDTISNITDRSGNGKHGDFSVIAAMPEKILGKLGQAYMFDGTNDYFYINGSPPISDFISDSAATLSVWLSPSGSAPSVAAAYSGRGAIGDSGGYIGIYRADISGSGDTIWAYNWDANEDRVGTSYNPGEWTHIVLVHGGGTLSLYKNGSFVGSTASGNTADVGSELGFGVLFADYWQGKLDDARTYNRALSAAEIKQLYNLGFVKIQ